MVRLMLDQLRNSPEDRQIVEAANKYLKGVKGHLVRDKRKARELAEAKAKGLPYPNTASAPQYTGPNLLSAANGGNSMYGQLEAARNAVKYPPYPRYGEVSSGATPKPTENERDVEQRLMEAFGV